MRTSGRRLIIVLLTAVLVGAFQTAAGDTLHEQATAAPSVVTAAQSGCGGAAIKYPSTPGQALTAADVGLTNPAAVAWFARMAALHVTWLRTLSCTAMPQHNNSYTPNWGGYVINNVGVGASTSMDWTLPGTTGTAGADSSVWAGQGGWNKDGELPQAGTESDRTSTGTTAYAWWEIYPDNAEQKITNFTVHVGDSMSEIVNTDVSKSVSFNICDIFTSQCVNIAKTAKNAIGPSAEWVAERPTVSGNYTKLADFGSTSIYNASATLIKNYYPSNGSPYDMRSCNGATVLASTGAYNSTSKVFTVTWKNYGSVEKAC